MPREIARLNQHGFDATVPLSSAEPAGARSTDRKMLDVSLFGRLRIAYDGVQVAGGAGSRALELFCYLLLFRDRPHHREGLASALWGEHYTTKQSKTYLRKALWQLQSSLSNDAGADLEIVSTDGEWVQIAGSAAFRLDVAVLEEAYGRVRDVNGAELSDEEAALLRAAVRTYTSDLLDGWYQEWCLIERERLQQTYLLMLDKLMSYCERAGTYEAGLEYGKQSLRCDGARERTYRQLIRLLYALGDRTGALRVYDQCVESLREELDAKPAAATDALIDAVRRGDEAPAHTVPARPTGGLAVRLRRLGILQRQLADLHERVLSEIDEIRKAYRTAGGDDS